MLVIAISQRNALAYYWFILLCTITTLEINYQDPPFDVDSIRIITVSALRNFILEETEYKSCA